MGEHSPNSEKTRREWARMLISMKSLESYYKAKVVQRKQYPINLYSSINSIYYKKTYPQLVVPGNTDHYSYQENKCSLNLPIRSHEFRAARKSSRQAPLTYSNDPWKNQWCPARVSMVVVGILLWSCDVEASESGVWP